MIKVGEKDHASLLQGGWTPLLKCDVSAVELTRQTSTPRTGCRCASVEWSVPSCRPHAVQRIIPASSPAAQDNVHYN